jgi:dihydrofolate reductase
MEKYMRKIVMQAPGAPDEDRDGGFTQGGWLFGYRDEITKNVMDGFMDLPFELLLGKRTYDIFSAYWPHDKTHSKIANKFNNTRKYVVSKNQGKLSWQNSKQIGGDVVLEIAKLKKTNEADLWVHGSGKLIQTLLANKFIDLMHVWTLPVTLGKGKRLFAEGARVEGLKLIDSKTSTTGVVIASYAFDGTIKSGSFVS